MVTVTEEKGQNTTSHSGQKIEKIGINYISIDFSKLNANLPCLEFFH